MRGFKPAEPGSIRRHVGTTLVQTCVFWTTFLLMIPTLLHTLEQRMGMNPFAFEHQRKTAIAGFVLASALGLWSGITMAWRGEGTPLPTQCPRKLVILGPYRYVRNPMAVAGLAQGFFVGTFIGSWLTLAYVASGFFIWNYFVRPIEEADLRERFGIDFDAYCRHVRCWIPRFRAWM